MVKDQKPYPFIFDKKRGLYKTIFDIESAKNLTVEEVQQSNFAMLKQVANANQEKQKDLMYVQFILCHEQGNLNFYWFFKDEIEQNYLSAIHKPYNWEHGEPKLGVITDSVLVKPPVGSTDPRWRIEVGAVIWKWDYPQYAQQVAQKAMTGELRNSMECYFQDYVYVLTNSEEQIIYSRQEKPFLDSYIGKQYQGYTVYQGFKGMFFGGAGIVANPADPDAVFLAVASRDNQIEEKDRLIEFIANDVAKEVEGMGNARKEVAEITKEVIEVTDINTETEQVDGVLYADNSTTEIVGDNDKATSTEQEIEQGGDEPRTDADDTGGEEDVATDGDNTDVAEEELAEEETEEEKEVEESEESPADESEPIESTDSAVEEKRQYVRKDNSVYERSKNSVLEWFEILNINSLFYNLLEALQYTIEEIVWLDVENKQALIVDEVMVFLSEMLDYVRDYYDSSYASKEEQADTSDFDELKQALEAMQQENSELKEALEKAQTEYDALKETVEKEQAERKKEELAESRLSELVELGYEIEGEKKERIKEKLKNYTTEQYEDFKTLFFEVVGPRKKTKKAENDSKISSDDSKISIDVSAINLETPPPVPLKEKLSKELRKLRNLE